MKIRFSPRASISIALVEVGNFARKKDEWKKKREEGRNEGGKRVGGRKKREEEGTAAFHNLISTSSSLVDPGTSLYRRSNATPPPTFRLNSFSKCERGRGRYRAFRTVSRSVSVLSFHRVSKDEGLLRFAVDWEGERRFIYWTWFMHSIRDFNRLSSAIPNFSFIFIADFF